MSTAGATATATATAGRRRRRRCRLLLGAAALITVAAGLAVHFLASGAGADFAGDALYAVLVYLVLALIAPRMSAIRVGALAFVLCAAVELFQLTGIPQNLVAAFPPTALLLGSTFSPVDVLAYAAGAATAVAVAAAWRAPAHVEPVEPPAGAGPSDPRKRPVG